MRGQAPCNRPATAGIPNPCDRFRSRGSAGRERWEIETLFGCLKTRGFDFECTHVVEPERVQKLVALSHRVLLVCRHRQMDEFGKGNQDKEARSKGN